MSHQDIHYRDWEIPYTGAAVTPTWATDRRSFDVSSVCPACTGPITKTVPRGLPTGSKSFWRRKEDEPPMPKRVTFVCECGYSHADRPPESTETGCGAAWKAPLA